MTGLSRFLVVQREKSPASLQQIPSYYSDFVYPRIFFAALLWPTESFILTAAVVFPLPQYSVQFALQARQAKGVHAPVRSNNAMKS